MYITEFRHSQAIIHWEEFIEILLNNMRDKTWIDEREVCGYVGDTSTYICIDRNYYIVIPITIGGEITPFEITILHKPIGEKK